MTEQRESKAYNNNDINELIKRVEQLEIENERVNNELLTLRKQFQREQSKQEKRAPSNNVNLETVEINKTNRSSTYLNIPTENLSSSVRASLSKRERERRSILPLSGKIATDYRGRRINIGDRVKSKTVGAFRSRFGTVVNIGSDRSDQIFFKDEDGYIQNRADKNLIIQDEHSY